MARKPEEIKKGAPPWMASFADLLMQLVVFFVFLYALSSLDLIRLRKALLSINAAFGGQSVLKDVPILEYRKAPQNTETQVDVMPGSIGNEHTEPSMQDKLNDILFIVRTRSIADDGVQGRYNDDGNIEITFKNQILFKSGSAELLPESYDILAQIGNALVDINNNIIIEGHTDDIAPNIKSGYHSNWELSSSRALNVAQIFIKRSNIRPERISIAGYGEYKPIVPNTSEKNREINRRVSVIIVKGQASTVY